MGTWEVVSTEDIFISASLKRLTVLIFVSKYLDRSRIMIARSHHRKHKLLNRRICGGIFRRRAQELREIATP
jgi:hypothetical protein